MAFSDPPRASSVWSIALAAAAAFARVRSPAMARLFLDQEPLTQYKDRQFRGSMEEYLECLRTSTTLYIGNVSFYTTEEQIWELFVKAGPVRAIIMGLDKNLKTPCGFCFVEYHNRGDAERAVKYLNGTKLDDREIRIDFDWGFQEGRQFGRGKSGGQVRDEYRTTYDAGRGGYGKLLKTELDALQAEDGGAGGEGYRGESDRAERGGGGAGDEKPPADAGAAAPGPGPAVGEKRAREEEAVDDAPKANPRFRGDGDDSEDD